MWCLPTLGPQDEKRKPEDEYFLSFLSFRRELFSKNTFPVSPNTNSLVCLSSLDKESAREGVLTEVEMNKPIHGRPAKIQVYLTFNRSSESAKKGSGALPRGIRYEHEGS